jgi:nucleoside 2-deoxyribosyltransferase
MQIYFAGSIRGGRNDQEIYSAIINLLKKYGLVLTEHIGDRKLFVTGEARDNREIYDRDMQWIEVADVVVAEVTNPSLGVGYEIGKAECRKPILCLFREQEGKKLSAMISGNKNLTLREYKTTIDIGRILEEFFSRF